MSDIINTLPWVDSRGFINLPIPANLNQKDKPDPFNYSSELPVSFPATPLLSEYLFKQKRKDHPIVVDQFERNKQQKTDPFKRSEIVYPKFTSSSSANVKVTTSSSSTLTTPKSGGLKFTFPLSSPKVQNFPSFKFTEPPSVLPKPPTGTHKMIAYSKNHIKAIPFKKPTPQFVDIVKMWGVFQDIEVEPTFINVGIAIVWIWEMRNVSFNSYKFETINKIRSSLMRVCKSWAKVIFNSFPVLKIGPTIYSWLKSLHYFSEINTRVTVPRRNKSTPDFEYFKLPCIQTESDQSLKLSKLLTRSSLVILNLTEIMANEKVILGSNTITPIKNSPIDNEATLLVKLIKLGLFDSTGILYLKNVDSTSLAYFLSVLSEKIPKSKVFGFKSLVIRIVNDNDQIIDLNDLLTKSPNVTTMKLTCCGGRYNKLLLSQDIPQMEFIQFEIATHFPILICDKRNQHPIFEENLKQSFCSHFPNVQKVRVISYDISKKLGSTIQFNSFIATIGTFPNLIALEIGDLCLQTSHDPIRIGIGQGISSHRPSIMTKEFHESYITQVPITFHPLLFSKLEGLFCISSIPLKFGGQTNLKQISISYDHTCFLMNKTFNSYPISSMFRDVPDGCSLRITNYPTIKCCHDSEMFTTLLLKFKFILLISRNTIVNPITMKIIDNNLESLTFNTISASSFILLKHNPLYDLYLIQPKSSSFPKDPLIKRTRNL